jgi:hypothetical protein
MGSLTAETLVITLPQSTLYDARISDAKQEPTVLSSAASQNFRLTCNRSPMPRWYRPTG